MSGMVLIRSITITKDDTLIVEEKETATCELSAAENFLDRI